MIFMLELSLYGDFIQISRVLSNYVMRDKWNTVDQNYFVYFGKKKKPWWYLPFLILFCSAWKRLFHSSIPLSMKFRLSSILVKHEANRIALKALIRTIGVFCPKKWKKKLGCEIYWNWMHRSTIQVDREDLYFEKIIKPRLGWWS